jgi:hypothetical protein
MPEDHIMFSKLFQAVFAIAIVLSVLFAASPALAAVESVTLTHYTNGSIGALNTGRIAEFTLSADAPSGFLNMAAIRAYSNCSYVEVNGVAVRSMYREVGSGCTGSVFVKAGDTVRVFDTNGVTYSYKASAVYEKLNGYSVFMPLAMR